MLVCELMTTPAISLRAGSTLEAAVQLLGAHHISAVPIVDAHHHVVGIVSEADVLMEGIVRDQHAEPGHHEASNATWHRIVDDVMTPDPVTVQENHDVGSVADLLATSGWKSLPVVRDGRLIGVISRSDIVLALGTPDAELARRIAEDFAEIGHQEWLVEVAHGAVTVRGAMAGREARIAKAIAQTHPGVRTVTMGLATPGPSPDDSGLGDSLLLKNLRRRPRAGG